MLIQFRLTNYKSFKDEALLSLVSTKLDGDSHLESNVATVNHVSSGVLKTAVVYGANASGKSKFVDAIRFLKKFVLDSAKDSQSGEPINVDPFRLNTTTSELGSEFEVTLESNGSIFRYGFEVNSTRVLSEWLYRRHHVKEIELFYREGEEFEVHSGFKGARLLVDNKLVRNNSLFISVAAQFNVEIAKEVLHLIQKIKVISGLREDGYHGYTIGQIRDSKYKSKILDLIHAADLGIRDISPVVMQMEQLPVDVSNNLKELIKKHQLDEKMDFLTDVNTSHHVRNEFGDVTGQVEFSLENDESSGTRKFFALMGPVLDSLENGYVLVIDEMDSKLHPNLSQKIVEMFQSTELNPHNAQLIFNTHNTNLLSSELFRRDQIWFTEKNREGASVLYSLAEFKSDVVRKGEAFESNYLKGKYGGVPFLNEFDSLKA